MINTDEINGAVQSFQNTVEAFKSIETISTKASEQLDSIQSSAASIKTATEEIVGKADSQVKGNKRRSIKTVNQNPQTI